MTPDEAIRRLRTVRPHEVGAPWHGYSQIGVSIHVWNAVLEVLETASSLDATWVKTKRSDTSALGKMSVALTALTAAVEGAEK